jgi:hypothetical protein
VGAHGVVSRMALAVALFAGLAGATGDFRHDVAPVGMNDGATLINRRGEILTPNRFLHIEPFSEGLAAVRIAAPSAPTRGAAWLQRELYGFIDTTGRVVVETTHAAALPFNEGLAAVRSGSGQWGFIDATGRVAIDFRFLDASPFSDGVATVRDLASGKWGVIDPTGRVVRPFNLSSADPFHEGVAAAGDVNGMGLIGCDGHFLFQRSITRP